jgi:hypothetical protein
MVSEDRGIRRVQALGRVSVIRQTRETPATGATNTGDRGEPRNRTVLRWIDTYRTAALTEARTKVQHTPPIDPYENTHHTA